MHPQTYQHPQGGNQYYPQNYPQQYSQQYPQQPAYQPQQISFVDQNFDIARSYIQAALDETVATRRMEPNSHRVMWDYLCSPDGERMLYGVISNAFGNNNVNPTFIYDSLLGFIADTAASWRRAYHAVDSNRFVNMGYQMADRGGYQSQSQYPPQYQRINDNTLRTDAMDRMSGSLPRAMGNRQVRHDDAMTDVNIPDRMQPVGGNQARTAAHDDRRTRTLSGTVRYEEPRQLPPNAEVMRFENTPPKTYTPIDLGDIEDDVVMPELTRVDGPMPVDINKVLTTSYEYGTTNEPIANMQSKYTPAEAYELSNSQDSVFVSVGRTERLSNRSYVTNHNISADVMVDNILVSPDAENVSGNVAAIVDVEELESISKVGYESGSSSIDVLVNCYNDANNKSVAQRIISVIDQLGRINGIVRNHMSEILISDFNEASKVHFTYVDDSGLEALTINKLSDLKDLACDSGRYLAWKSNTEAFKTAFTRCIQASFSRMFSRKRKHYLDPSVREELRLIIKENSDTLHIEKEDGTVINMDYIIEHGLTNDIIDDVQTWAERQFIMIRHRKYCLTTLNLPKSTYAHDNISDVSPYLGDTNDMATKVLRTLTKNHGAFRLICTSDLSTYISPILFGVGYDNQVLIRRMPLVR